MSSTIGGAGGIGGLMGIRQNGTNYLIRGDGRGNVTEVRRTNGTVVASYGYSPFGQLLYQTNTLAQDFRFSTRLTHGRSGYVYFLGRWYDPNTGRWLSRDPIQENGGLNLYQYVGNNPVNFVDPLGLVRVGDAFVAGLGIAGNTFGLVLGFGLGVVPEPTLLTKVVAVGVVAKSGYGLGANVDNLIAALFDKEPVSQGSLINDVAAAAFPCNENVQKIATASDLAADLVVGRISARAAQNSLGKLYPYDVIRSHYPNPSDLGFLATGLQAADLTRVTINSLHEVSTEWK